MSASDILFTISAVVCIASAILIVSQKNPVYSVVYMLPFFLGMTMIFVLLQATFLAAIQMIVYGGAILVVFLFVIMLINLKPEELRDDFAFGPYLFTTVGILLLGLGIGLLAKSGVTPDLEQGFGRFVGAIIVRAGEKIPFNGVIVDGSTEVSESPTPGGKSIPKSQGDSVVAGSINGTGVIQIQDQVSSSAPIFGSAESLAAPLFKQQLVPFELASILIVVAMLGAILLSKKKV